MIREQERDHWGFWLWFLAIAPSSVWLAHLSASFLVAGYACANGLSWGLRAMTVAALGITAFAIYKGFQVYRFYSRGDDEDLATRRFVALLALLLAGLITLTIATSELSNHLVEPCL